MECPKCGSNMENSYCIRCGYNGVFEENNTEKKDSQDVASSKSNNDKQDEILPTEENTKKGIADLSKQANTEKVISNQKNNKNNFNVYNSVYDEVSPQIPREESKRGSYFDGKFLPYIAYSYLANFLKTLTAGIGIAWGDTIIASYKYNHTTYSDKKVKFEGKGIDLYPEVFKWILFTVLTLGIYALWIPIKKEKWMVSKLHFEDEEYIEGHSYFDGGLLGLIGVNIFSAIITVISLGILLPYAYCYKQKWFAKHTVISRKRIIFDGKAISLIGHWLWWWFLTIITFGIYGLWLPIKLYSWKVKNTHIKLKSEPMPSTSKGPAILGIVLLVFIIIGVVIGLLNSDFDISNINPFKAGIVDDSNKVGNIDAMSTEVDQANSFYR